MALLWGEGVTGYGLPFCGLAGTEGGPGATSRDGERGEAAVHRWLLPPVPSRRGAINSSEKSFVWNDPVQWKGKAGRDHTRRMLTRESMAKVANPMQGSHLQGLRPWAASPAHGQNPGSFARILRFFQDSHNVFFLNSAEEPQTMLEDHSAPHCRVCFQNEAWFHFLARYNSAFAMFVVLLWKIHGKANYCADPVFNISSGSEWGTMTVLPRVVWLQSPQLTRALVATEAAVPAATFSLGKMGSSRAILRWSRDSPDAAVSHVCITAPDRAQICLHDSLPLLIHAHCVEHEGLSIQPGLNQELAFAPPITPDFIKAMWTLKLRSWSWIFRW